MAVVVFLDGRKQVIPHDKAEAIWRVLNGEVEPNQEQLAFCMQVKDLYLNLHEAPESYLEKYPQRRASKNDPVPIKQTSMFPSKRNSV